MQKITLYIAEHKNGLGKWQTAYNPRHESQEAAEAEAKKDACGRDHRVRIVKAIKLEIGDKVEGRRETGRFSDNRDEYQITGSQVFAGTVAADARSSCGLRIGNHSLSHPYIVAGKGAGLSDVKVIA